MYAQILRNFLSSPLVGDLVLVHSYEIARKMSGRALVHTYKYAITRLVKSVGLSAGSSSVLHSVGWKVPRCELQGDMKKTLITYRYIDHLNVDRCSSVFLLLVRVQRCGAS